MVDPLEPPAVEAPDLVPPDDADDWTHEQWCAWIQAIEQEPEDLAPVRRRGRGAGSALGAAMLGLEQIVAGRVAKPEITIEVEADGQDDGLVLIDPDDPAASVISVPPT